MKIDWQEYEDGGLDPEMKRKADELLKSSPKARQELEGLRQFRKALRKAALAEPVPARSLRDRLRQITRPARQSAGWRWAGAAVAACALAVAAVVFMPRTPGQIAPSAGSPVRLATSSVPQAHQFASRHASFSVPTVQLAGTASLDGVECCQTFVCYDFMLDGELYHVKINEEPCTIGEVVERDGMQFRDAAYIAFESDGLTYRVSGGTEEGRWIIAEAVAQERASASTRA